ncbi:hypothetical protein GE09DRAFT_1232746 [Coniochaeta sp. 2T2.1]|nr:hypothetical protein GE09DRAFT_1232746 [Coniochaeta sp. 2T2.1]
MGHHPTSGSDHVNGQVRHQHPPNNSMKRHQCLSAALRLPGPRLRQCPPDAHGQSPADDSGAADSSRISEQEYDAQADMIDDSNEPDTPSGPGPYPGAQYGGEPQPMSLPSPVTSMPPTNQQIPGHSPMDGVQQHQQHHAHHQQQQQQHAQQQGQQHQGGGYPSMTQLLDPGLDWDPFGLSASMAFPSQFSFDTSNMR